ncbi:hypothetical protein [Streptomyces sp. NBC_00576]|uniref:hypothetical protein n=1 Tax=Streptomyces sp. NBC_00576 TaxID=2903665 RepID=UPI002E8050A8|nr:hypothetical protein [Streptomyces sp. NBC_00576]WUB68855.1 hypothetical protein OG734_01415 [Streptomyces sp. NBC_00576]
MTEAPTSSTFPAGVHTDSPGRSVLPARAGTASRPRTAAAQQQGRRAGGVVRARSAGPGGRRVSSPQGLAFRVRASTP